MARDLAKRKRTRSYDDGPDVALAMKRILLHRYAIRVTHAMPSLFEEIDPDPQAPLKADSGVAHVARLHLHHEYERPFHYEGDDIYDASNENAEVFLQFAGALVANIETRAIRNNQLPLSARNQQTILIDKAKGIMDAWPFPHARACGRWSMRSAGTSRQNRFSPTRRSAPEQTRSLSLRRTLEALSLDDELGTVLKHAIANGAITIERNYGQGGKLWALIELTGLTFARGGFLPKKIEYLRQVTGPADA